VGEIHGNGGSDLEDLAFPNRQSREADGIGRRVCLSTVGTIAWNDLGHGHSAERESFRAELRRRREGRRENGVKNLKGAKPLPCILPTQSGEELIKDLSLYYLGGKDRLQIVFSREVEIFF
jgi:hypothetical protein